jgi:hypothetical protein
MPILAINGRPVAANGATQTGIVPLGSWTVQQVVSEAMILTGTLDNEESVFVENVRNHYNMNLSHLADLLNLASSPFYGTYLTGLFETILHPFSGVHWINLGNDYDANINVTPATAVRDAHPGVTAVNTNVVNKLHSIKGIAINFRGVAPGDGAYTSQTFAALNTAQNYTGNIVKWDLSKVLQQSNNLNIQHGQTIAYCHHGEELLFFVGQQIATPLRGAVVPASPAYTIVAPTAATANAGHFFTIWAFRQPMLDNLIPISTTATTGYFQQVDLPDRYIKLLVDMIAKNIYQQKKEAVPQNIEQSIQTGLAQISQNLEQAARLEQQAKLTNQQG